MKTAVDLPLLDSQNYPKPSDGEKANAHQLFQLTAANNGKLPVSMYVELDLKFLGIVVPKVGVLVTQEPNELLESCHKTKLPGMVGWNLIKLAYRWPEFDKTGLSGVCEKLWDPIIFHKHLIGQFYQIPANHARQFGLMA